MAHTCNPSTWKAEMFTALVGIVNLEEQGGHKTEVDLKVSCNSQALFRALDNLYSEG